MAKDFADWVIEELKSRGWNNSELARRAGLGNSTISGILSYQRRPGLDFCIGVARAFKLPPEDVLRRAGLLPPVPEPVAEEEKLVYHFRQLREQGRKLALALMETLYREMRG